MAIRLMMLGKTHNWRMGNNMKHTKGPWKIESGVSNRVYLINDEKNKAIGEVVYCDTRKPQDAALIAAAPEMLEALEAVMAAMPHSMDTMRSGWENQYKGTTNLYNLVAAQAEAMVKVQSAIRKAKGE